MFELRECKIHGVFKHTLRKDGHWRCNQCSTESVQKRRLKIKLMSIKYKGGKCIKCGYNKCIAALEFHHLDSNIKDFGISSKGYTKSWEKVKIELDKCELVCSNCHMEIHHGDFGELNDILNNVSLSPMEKNVCKNCGKELRDCNSIYCTKCYHLSKRKVERPSKEKLIELIIQHSFVSIGKMYDVSDNTIRKWCKYYDINFKEFKK